MVKEMDGHDKGVSSSMSIKASEIPRVSASDENDQIHQEMGSNIQTTKKSTPKHYMSQTISTAGKVAVPRKKILAERNEAPESLFSYTHVQKTPMFESKLTFANLGTDISDLSSPQGFQSGDNEQNALVADGSLRPYDPLKNYLSPRPKFLRYMPNRRRDIFLHREKEIREGKDELYISTSGSFEIGKASDEDSDSVCGPGSLVSPHEGSVQQEEEEETDESDEEIEEVEEERGWSLKRVLDFLFWFFVFILSTFYIYSMNSPAPSPSLQSCEGLKGGYYKIPNQTLEAFLAMRLESGSDIWDRVEEIQMGLDRGRQRDIKEGIEEEKTVKDVKMGGVEIAEELNEVVYPKGGKSKGLEVVEDEKKGTVDDLREVIEPQAADIDEGSDHAIANTRDFSDRLAENSELQIGETIQKFEAFQDYQAPSTFDGRDYQIIESDIANILKKENDVLVEPAEEVYNEQAGDEEMVETKMNGMESVTIKAGEVISSERRGNGDTDIEILNLEAEGNLEGLTKHLETELLLLKAVIGVSVFSVIVAFLVLGFHFKRKKTSENDSCLFAKPCSESLIVEQEETIGKDYSMIPKPYSESLSIGQSKTIRKDSLIVKPCIEYVLAEKHSSVLHNRGEEVHMERVDSFVSHSSFHPMEESSKDDYESRVPTIELLGEFVVGEMSSSLRSCGMKNKRIESEDSNYSVSTEKKSRSKVHSVHVQSQPAFSEFSTMDCHSCARYTSEKKIVKKEGGKDGEANVITTPVRRSSRICNRSVRSP